MFMHECVLLCVSFGMACVCVFSIIMACGKKSESVGTGLDGPVVSPRGQQVEHVRCRMGGVTCDCLLFSKVS